ncbi:MAG: hypothetical protein KBD39_03290 [Sterolibacterium sp.]|jgi:hypothetical protein|nr:hypothetical protein [Sterolibacterium sp.]
MLTCESKILLMQRLQDYARLDYRFYFQGEVGLEKLNSLSRKFAQQYDTELSKFQRARRKRSGEAVTQLLIWIPEDSDKARFWLMATEGKGRVHEYETLRDLRDKSNRISLSDYELVHDGVSWSWRMTQATYTFHQKRLRNAILARNDLLYGVAVASLYQSPGFRLVRRQVGMLARWLRMEWGKLRKEPMPELPTFLAYVRRLPNPVAKTRRKVQDSTRQQVAESEPA